MQSAVPGGAWAMALEQQSRSSAICSASLVARVLAHEGGHARGGHGLLKPVQELAKGHGPDIGLGQRIIQEPGGVGRKLGVLQEGRVDGDLKGPTVAGVGGVKGAGAGRAGREGGKRATGSGIAAAGRKALGGEYDRTGLLCAAAQTHLPAALSYCRLTGLQTASSQQPAPGSHPLSCV